MHATGRPPRVMVVEVANSNINWMEPRDLTLEEACRGVGDGSGLGISSHHMIPGRFFFQDEVAGAYACFPTGAWDSFLPDCRRRRSAACSPATRRHGRHAKNSSRSSSSGSTGPTAPPWPCSSFPTRCCSFVRGINFRRKRSRPSQAHRLRPMGTEAASDVRSRWGTPLRAPSD